MKKIIIPAGPLAGPEEDALKRKREELKQRLLIGKTVMVGKNGSVTGSDGTPNIEIKGDVKLAGPEEDALKRKREELRERLLKNKKVMVGKNGSVTGSDGTPNIEIKGDIKLAVQQWYEKDPILLAAEKAAMQHAFPNFVLDKLDDGRLCWVGSLNLGLGFRDWEVMAVYNNNHPEQVMGSSVKVFLVEPDIDDLIEGLGERPHHLLRDHDSGLSYLCTARAQDVKASKTESTSAAQSIAMAVRWLMAFELVLSGELSWEDFNTPGKI